MSEYLNKIQDCLNFKGCKNEQFSKNGIGKIGTTGFVIGAIGGLHFGMYLSLAVVSFTAGSSPFINSLITWCSYMTLLCTFHFLEFFSTAVNQPSNLAYESFIVNHSKSYTIAALASWTEYWIEYSLFGKSKLWGWVTVFGVVLVLAGQVLRTVSMWQCGEHFSHLIMDEKTDRHRLVTGGVYRYFRHPSYVGWFYWSVGTQLILCNPICTVLYTLASWSFFKDRIPYEESLLLQFYKNEYVVYGMSTLLGIPFVSSPIDDLRKEIVNNKNEKDD